MSYTEVSHLSKEYKYLFKKHQTESGVQMASSVCIAELWTTTMLFKDEEHTRYVSHTKDTNKSWLNG